MLLNYTPDTSDTTTLKGIPPGSAGTAATLKEMRQLVASGKKEPAIRRRALSLVEHLPSKDFYNEIVALYQYVRDTIRYVHDIHGVETLHTAIKVLEKGQGDCDDQSILLASLLESIGHPTRFVAIGFLPGQFIHVYTETKYGVHWVPLETTVAGASIGWKPSGVKSVMVRG